MKVEIEAEVPEGFKAVAWRKVKEGDYYVHRGNLRGPTCGSTESEFLIVEPIVKYREPTQADMGKTVEVSDDEVQWWSHKLLAVLPVGEWPFIAQEGNDWEPYAHARIIDDGQPAKVAREWWIYRGLLCVGQQEDGNGVPLPNQVHVREVIE